MAYFDQVLHKNACQNYLTTGMCNIFFDVRGFAKDHFNWLWSVSENTHNSVAQKNVSLRLFFSARKTKAFRKSGYNKL